MRLFVALPVSEEAREHVRRAVEPLWRDDRLAWTRPDGWHVTLAFLGEVEDDPAAVADVGEVVGPVASRHPPVTLTSGEVSVLGRGPARYVPRASIGLRPG